MTRQMWHPRPSQLALLEFAGHRDRVAWWAKMGAGKTAAAIEWLRRAHEDSYSLNKALIVAPNLVAKHTWPAEIAKWAHGASIGPARVLTHQDFDFKRSWDVLDGPGGLQMGDWRAVRKRLAAYPELVHVAPWDWLWWVVKAFNQVSPYSHLILDEADFVANHQSARWKAARYLIAKLGCANVLELTGGPAPNGYEQLWSQMFLLDGGLRLGRTLTAFRETWMIPDKVHGKTGRVFSWKPAPARRAELDALIAQLAISVEVDLGVASEVVDHRIPLPPAAQDVYDELERDLIFTFEYGQVVLAANQAVLVGKLLQVAQGAIYDEDRIVQHVHDVKLDKLEELLDSSPRGVLLAYPYQHDWARIKSRFKHAVHIGERSAIDRFSSGKVKLLCLHPASGAHGIDGLQTNAHTIVWFGMTHRYEHYSQFNARLVRPGQRETVIIHRIMAAGTLEEDVADVSLAEKRDEQDALLAAVQWRLR